MKQKKKPTLAERLIEIERLIDFCNNPIKITGFTQHSIIKFKCLRPFCEYMPTYTYHRRPERIIEQLTAHYNKLYGK